MNYHYKAKNGLTNTQWLFGPEKNSFHYWSAPRGPRGVKKSHFFFSKMKLFSFCAKIAHKRHKLQKTIKIEENMSINPCFLGLFWIFLNLGAILAQQTSTGMFSGSWCIFWHPWDLWGICFDYFVTVLPPGGFFTFMKMLPNVSFIIKVIKNSGFVSNSQNFIVSRESHPLKA